MSRAGFDYLMVWTPSLMTASPVVHEPRAETESPWRREDGSYQHERRTRCGSLATFECRSEERNGRGMVAGSYQDHGLYLYAGHALRLDMRWCRRCWPNGYPS